MAEVPDVEVSAGKLCGFSESSPCVEEDGTSGPMAKGNSTSSIDMIQLGIDVFCAA